MQFWYVPRLSYWPYLTKSTAFTIGDVTSTSPPYMPQNNACTCNLVAYNLQAACGWCQSTIETNWWLDEAQWAGNCTTSTFDATGIPSSVATSSINIPSWAFLSVTGATWDPSVASAAAVIVSGVNTNVGTGTAAPTITGGNTGANNGFTFSYNPYTDTGSNNPYYFDAYYSTGVAGYVVALGMPYPPSLRERSCSLIRTLGIIFGSYALLGITIRVVYWMRQKRRKAWYGLMAQYYHQSGVGGYQGNYASGGSGQPYQPAIYQTPTPFKSEAAGAPLLYNNEPNIPRTPPTNQSSLYAGGSSPAPVGYNCYQPPPSGTNPYQPPPPSGATSFNTAYPPSNNTYGAPQPGVGGTTGGFKGHAEFIKGGRGIFWCTLSISFDVLWT
jgi:hypothetical protein